MVAHLNHDETVETQHHPAALVKRLINKDTTDLELRVISTANIMTRLVWLLSQQKYM